MKRMFLGGAMGSAEAAQWGAVLVRVPDEPHEIALLPSHHITKMLYIAGWFEQYKK